MNKTFYPIILVVALCVCIFSRQASAQSAQTPTDFLEQFIDDRISEAEIISEEEIPLDSTRVGEFEEGAGFQYVARYTLSIEQVTPVSITVRALDENGIDPVLVVRESGNILAFNDDTEGFNSFLETTFRVGEYELLVTSFNSNSGSFEIAVASLDKFSSAENEAILNNLTLGTPFIANGYNNNVRSFVFTSDRQREVVVLATSFGLGDLILEVTNSESYLGGEDEFRIVDDDSGIGLDPLISFVAEADTEYRLEVSTFGNQEPDEFAVIVADRDIQLISQGDLEVGTSIVGEFASTDLRTGHISQPQFYRIFGVEGDQLVVDLTSSQFDTVLSAGTFTPLGFASFADDDDGGEGTNSTLHLTWRRDGWVVLKVESFDYDDGEFTLTVERNLQE